MIANLPCCVAILLAISLLYSTIAAESKEIYWNSSNAQFYQSGHGMAISAELMDTVDIHCPHYEDTVKFKDTEVSIIYMVSKYGYDNCVLDKPIPVGQCLSPYGKLSIKLKLREFSPLPNGPEFRSDDSYYFITTSDGTLEGLRKESAGLCESRNLKMILYIRNRSDRIGKVKTGHGPMDVSVQLLQKSGENRLHSRVGSRIQSNWNRVNLITSNEDESPVLMDRPAEERNVVHFANFKNGASEEQPVILYEVHELSNLESDAYHSAAATISTGKPLWLLIGSGLMILYLRR